MGGKILGSLLATLLRSELVVSAFRKWFKKALLYVVIAQNVSYGALCKYKELGGPKTVFGYTCGFRVVFGAG
jgi:hypothetical protein